MSEGSKLVVLEEAASPFIAQLVKGMLEGEGIPAQIKEEFLVDEFAMSQKLINRAGVAVLVPEDQLEKARSIINGARSSQKDKPGGVKQY